MELSELKYFYEVAKTEHLTKAADSLHISQPALTKTIKNLEEELGVKLFYKDGRRIRLNEYGRFLKEKLEPILKEIDLLPASIEKLIDLSQNVIVVNVLAASTLITDIIIEFKKNNPDVVFRMLQKESEKNYDILVTTNATVPDNPVHIKTRGIIEEKIYVAVPKTSDLAERNSLRLSELAGRDFIALSGSRRFRPLCDAYCEYAGFTPQVVFESDSLIAVKNLIAAGIGVAFWPEFSWGKIDGHNIKLLEIEKPVCQREIIAYLSDKEEADSIAEKFFVFLMKKLSERQAKMSLGSKT